MKINSTEIKNLEPIKTIAISHIGDYAGIAGAFEKLAAWAGANNLWAASPKMAGVYHDDPMHTPVEKLRSEACLENVSGIEPGKGMQDYTISGGKYFVMQVEVTMSEYGEAWQKVSSAFNDKGYEYDMRDHYELYVSCAGDTQDADAPWIVNLCIPMK
ncbi:GyrI-like small molecule binding domain [Proteiniphilum saccharofermentans]|uniref:GyrI-like small molecule binding domain n=1 Tax=Proteiniphilum saccharofermentans TaxID=1642647 RepID=A0A1R3T449_9BACT|nr:GyrI-like domain-containing protein [Proteiniphilum saccharofermentans]SCD21980.1 GyrI-like small molecule binding domain [Proteiniphilum saccharofermentans]SFS63689.1 DNA gyrase inhibitor GyrI [Porphyromonadaceae bacterium NLAE-zl-C104]